MASIREGMEQKDERDETDSRNLNRRDERGESVDLGGFHTASARMLQRCRRFEEAAFRRKPLGEKKKKKCGSR